jgi:hypothetical protein
MTGRKRRRRAQTPAYFRSWRARRREERLCVHCGDSLGEADVAACAECRLIRRLKRSAS